MCLVTSRKVQTGQAGLQTPLGIGPLADLRPRNFGMHPADGQHPSHIGCL